MDEKTSLLICLGASAAANCIPCFEHYHKKASAAGLTSEEILEAVELANKVKSGAHLVMHGFHWWWLIPLAMMILCFIMMRGRMGGSMGGSRSRHRAESAREILDKRYALGEIGKEEYQEKKRDISFPSV